MAQMIVRHDGLKLLGQVFALNDVIPNDLWLKVPQRNRQALVNIKRVVEDKVVVKRPTRRRKRKRAA